MRAWWLSCSPSLRGLWSVKFARPLDCARGGLFYWYTWGMVLNWVLYVGLGVVAYIGISLMGQLGGMSSASAVQSLVNAYRPLTLAVMLLANGIWIA